MVRLLAALLVTLFVTGDSALAAVTAWTDVTVRVYDVTGLDARTRQNALDLARSSFTAASVNITWHVCERTEKRSPRCDTRLAPGELSIRILRAPASHEHGGSIRLGDAYIDAYAGRGVLATVYLDRVMRLADAAGKEPHVLLGHAIAHELGHLLLATNTHGPVGLMRALWSQDEVRNSRPMDWRFSPRDANAIHLGAEAIRTRAGVSGTN